MLCYVKINDFEGLYYSEGQGCTSDTKLESGKCGSCIFYFYCELNFQYEIYICNGCYHCLQYKRRIIEDCLQKKELQKLQKKELSEPFAGGPLCK